VNLGSGLCYVDIAVGQGDQVEEGAVVRTHFTLWLEDGQVADSNAAPDDPEEFTFGAGDVVDGLELGMEFMREGGWRRIVIPSELGYGATIVSGIPPNSTLIYNIELVEIVLDDEPPSNDNSVSTNGDEPDDGQPTGSTIYWMDVETDLLQRFDLDSSEVIDLAATGTIDPAGLALDGVGGKVYWPETSNARIQRANLDGSEPETLAIEGLRYPAGVALDLDNGLIYFTDRFTNKVRRANLDGSNAEDLVTEEQGADDPQGIALDVPGDRMYWADSATDSIWSADLDGSDAQEIIQRPASILFDIALDPEEGMLYYTDRQSARNHIRSARVDGEQDAVLFGDGVVQPRGLAIDLVDRKLYFGDEGTGAIMRIDLDGTGLETVVSDVAVDPRAVGILIEH
ncbi:MAG TPA: FKBP-type peptidyl-prolyl cis-trans isomerase, partial [Phycisphaerae bacterium]|nr:FKBP-type peptidyl-prolyl cis-trans isomerase [Phycisphaerae bacterium]